MEINVCSYSRVSTDVQDYNRQIADIKSECKKEGFTILEEFAEKMSGRKKVRPELTRMLNYCKEHADNISFVVVSELSRLGRTSEVLNTIEQLHAIKIGVYTIKEKLQTLNADKKPNTTTALLISILSAINSFELDTTKYRSMSGLLNSAMNGNWGGGKLLPYGYKREEGGKKLVIHEKESIVIEEIFKMYVNGKGTGQIATILQGRGTPTRTGVKWRDKVIYDIIRNPIYYGNRIYHKDQKATKSKPERKGQAIVIKAPAIINEELYIKANERRRNNYNKLGNNNKYNYLLNKGLIKCGVCGKTYFPHKRASGNDNTYKCISIRYKENCGNYGISINKLEYAIRYVFLFEYVHLVKLENDLTEEFATENRIYDDEIKKLEKAENRLIDGYIDGTIPKIKYLEKQEELKVKQKKLLALKEANTERMEDIEKAKVLIRKEENHFVIKKITKDMLQQVIKQIVVTKNAKKLTTNPMDKTVKVDIHSITGQIISIYLSQRSKFFTWKINGNDNKVEYDNQFDNEFEILATGK